MLASDTLQALPHLTHDGSFPRGFVVTLIQQSAPEVNRLCVQSGHLEFGGFIGILQQKQLRCTPGAAPFAAGARAGKGEGQWVAQEVEMASLILRMCHSSFPVW